MKFVTGISVATLAAVLGLAFARPTLAGKSPPANPAIAAVRTQTNSKGVRDTDLVVMNADGTNLRVVVNGTAGVLTGFGKPDWSPDGRQIAFKSDIQGSGVYVVNADGTGLRKVVSTSRPDGPASWSPVAAADGMTKIAFSDTRTGSAATGLWVVNLDGSGLAELATPLDATTADYGTGDPSWAPDARALVATVHDSGSRVDAVLYGVGLVGGSLAVTSSLNLTDDATVSGGTINSYSVSMPRWSRSGTRIAVKATAMPPGAPGKPEIWLIDPANPAAPTCITPASVVQQLSPDWSPDDSKLVVSQWNGGNCLYTMYANGTGLREIAHGYTGSPYPYRSWGNPAWRRNP